MLSRPSRLTDGADYKAVVRRGVRSTSPHLITYVVASEGTRAPRFGFIVSKQVGGAVTRNLVRRRLKAICAEARGDVAPGRDIVIRALPAAAAASFSTLRGDVRTALQRRAS
ncbi:MAG: ribonuclease P protein component [Microbacterium sp.]|uniref:Ribonuclease P protein component n=1 Tax=Microbacterium ginsengisoli TaxID=400772 RepID=A0A0F0LX40_9MICO|nr:MULTISPECIES: ribonuclease P protein component [Microbacterium]MAL05605.1 ribonuclease P protein component [Microbacterium sp.]ODU77514.1 MAG: ribonuclease P protein component [Microbacterium sp. SCN 71-21]KJL35941.1 Ribonuclease P protein component [Microbacterium ginsengisoli]MBN9197683.1 ribonuclease P protein component [Microbacterium ginsengisoli]MBN9208411.1 ribonuclease P protein component [Microbacterium ginsengisoli]